MVALATFVKDEEHCVEHMLASVHNCVSEIVVVDTGSTDRTVEICRDYGARVYEVGFTDFGKIRTVTAHLCRDPWVLMLDADETLSRPELLNKLILSGESRAYALARKRWLDLDKKNQTELDAWPDWQVRLFRNHENYKWKRELHEFFDGTAVHHVNSDSDQPYAGMWINHFQDVFKNHARNMIRDELYKDLAEKAGVHIVGGKSLEENSTAG